MTSCAQTDVLLQKEHPTLEDDREIARHLAACDACASMAERDAALADALVAAASAASRFRRVRRAAASTLLAATLVAALGLSLRSLGRPRVVYVIRGDSSGVVLTGPGIARRSETAPPPPVLQKGDRT